MLFSIHNLKCRYGSGPIVLEVPSLHIPRGELVFIIGSSGIGKSTLLEALGLMNRTIDPADPSTTVFFTEKNGQKHALSDLWGKTNTEISEFRSRFYSFIFQQTNLMSHFSAGENMAATRLIGGMKKTEAISEVQQIMKTVGLEASVFDRRITDLSGGQRQRLAFVRAFTSFFEVLFADEPTGNLDPVTGQKLMSILRRHLDETQKTGILVSHDIGLAVKFANRIIPIKSVSRPDAPDKKSGIIQEESIFVRPDQGKPWTDFHGKTTFSNDEISSRLESYLTD